jgi:hypothetical protein
VDARNSTIQSGLVAGIHGRQREEHRVIPVSLLRRDHQPGKCECQGRPGDGQAGWPCWHPPEQDRDERDDAQGVDPLTGVSDDHGLVTPGRVRV